MFNYILGLPYAQIYVNYQMDIIHVVNKNMYKNVWLRSKEMDKIYIRIHFGFPAVVFAPYQINPHTVWPCYNIIQPLLGTAHCNLLDDNFNAQ